MRIFALPKKIWILPSLKWSGTKAVGEEQKRTLERMLNTVLKVISPRSFRFSVIWRVDRNKTENRKMERSLQKTVGHILKFFCKPYLEACLWLRLFWFWPCRFCGMEWCSPEWSVSAILLGGNRLKKSVQNVNKPKTQRRKYKIQTQFS